MTRSETLRSRGGILMLNSINIGGISMPRTKTLEIGGENVAVEREMASGKYVRDIIGWRTTLEAGWEWLPADTLSRLVALARQGGYVTISYPTAAGDESGKFRITIGNQKIFKFVGGEPMWYNVELSAVSQEVNRYAGS